MTKHFSKDSEDLIYLVSYGTKISNIDKGYVCASLKDDFKNKRTASFVTNECAWFL